MSRERRTRACTGLRPVGRPGDYRGNSGGASPVYETMRRPLSLAPALTLFVLANPASFAADVTHGNTLYHTYSTACHRFPPQARPAPPANNPGLVRPASNHIAAM